MASPAPGEYVLLCQELLSSPGAPCTARRMFGGWGLFRDGLMFGLVADEQLYLKADDLSRAPWEAAACRPFCYEARGRTVSLRYYAPPEEAMESVPAMQPWARLAWEAALRGQQRKVRDRKAPVARGPRKPLT